MVPPPPHLGFEQGATGNGDLSQGHPITCYSKFSCIPIETTSAGHAEERSSTKWSPSLRDFGLSPTALMSHCLSRPKTAASLSLQESDHQMLRRTQSRSHQSL